jgi:hypothetical protein
MSRGSVRREVRIEAPAAAVWARITDAGAIHTWFPGITATAMNGTTRVITMGSGLPMPEEILTNDSLLRRFQYRITAPLFRYHLSTLDVIELEPGACLAVYSVDADPGPMALVIGGAAHNALVNLKHQLETAPAEAGS